MSSRGQRASRAEARNQAAREALEPLEEGQRPTAVTIAALVTGLLFVLTIAGYALWDVLRDDPRPPVSGLIVFAGLTGAMTYGMWRARYWAVLGFQTFLLFVLLGTGFGILQASRLTQVIGNSLLFIGGGLLFWFMIKAMARIQMPERLPRD